MGSGTTAQVCIEEERNYIGFEIDTQYYTMCEQRVLDNTPHLLNNLVEVDHAS